MWTGIMQDTPCVQNSYLLLTCVFRSASESAQTKRR